MRISDWSSDVCSSDLATAASAGPPRLHDDLRHPHRLAGLADDGGRVLDAEGSGKPAFLVEVETALPRRHQLGRASCRERVCQYVLISVVAVYLKNNNKKLHLEVMKDLKRK